MMEAPLKPASSSPEFFPDKEVELPPALRGLEPKLVWSAFATLLAIPRESGHEGPVREALISYAQRRGFEFQTDNVGNLVIRVPSKNAGLGSAILAIQAHMDMVCVADKGVEHDFRRDPITPKRYERELNGRMQEVLGAEGTTLGADNGIGLAMALALLEDASLVRRPPLEIVFTVDEERGLKGARNIGPGMITAPNLINLDTEEEGQIYRSCAGSYDFATTFNFQREVIPDGFVPLSVEVEGLKGGHSGVNIDKGIVNPFVVLCAGLEDLLSEDHLRLGSIRGGSKRNAIPSDVGVTLWVEEAKLGQAQRQIQESWEKFSAICFPVADLRGSLKFSSPDVDATPQPMTSEDGVRIIAGIKAIYHGVVGMSEAVPGLVETSNNLAIIETHKDSIVASCMARSSKLGAAEKFIEQISASVSRWGGRLVTTDAYEGWEPEPNSALMTLTEEVHTEVLGSKPKIMDVHAGLECGPFKRIKPQLHMTSFGPDIGDAHSTLECVSIPSVERVWSVLRRLVEKAVMLPEVELEWLDPAEE